MQTFSSSEYIQTKEIKRGSRKLNSPFLELQAWFHSEYDVKPINIIYEILSHSSQPRLSLIWENNDGSKFCDWKSFNEKEKVVINKFKSLNQFIDEYPTENLFIINENFSYAALLEANSKVSDEEIKTLVGQLTIYGLWKVIKRQTTAVFFFNTKVQASEYSSPELINKFSNQYWSLVKKYDEFGYSTSFKGTILIDSKETIDKDYDGSLRWYFNDN